MNGAVLVDAGPLIALLDRSDPRHQCSVSTLETLRGPLRTVWPVVTEVAHFLGSAPAKDLLLSLVATGEVALVNLDQEDVARMRELLVKYADVPMDLADAAVVRAAEREGIRRVFTFDGDFRLYRPNHAAAFEVIP